MMPVPAITDETNDSPFASPTKSRKKLPKSQSFYQRLKFTASPEPSTVHTEDRTRPKDTDGDLVEELKSVQSLKQFWINAFGSVRGRHRRRRSTRSASSPVDVDDVADDGDNSRTRKCATLGAKTTTTTATTKPATSATEPGETGRKSTTLHRNFVSNSGATSATDSAAADDNIPNTSRVPAQIAAAERRHSNAVDNFYKYKTADMVRQQSVGGIASTASIQMLGAGPVAVGAVGATPVHWARRNDVIAATVVSGSKSDRDADTQADDVTDENHIAGATTSNDKITATGTLVAEQHTEVINPNTTSQSRMSHAKTAIDAANSARRPPPPLNSSNSLGNSSNHSTSTASGGGITRKSSFRTNGYQPPHSRRQGSKVAALTHRFNQLCSLQDARDLIGDEMRQRSSDVIVHRAGGRLFRVMKEEELLKRSGSRSSADSSPVRPSGARKRGSVKRKESMRARQVTPKTEDKPPQPAAIEEAVPQSPTTPVKGAKPKVPDKSAQVLLLTKEIARRNMAKLRTVEESSKAPVVVTEVALDIAPPAVESHETKEPKQLDHVDNNRPEIPVSTPATPVKPTDLDSPTNEENPKKNKYVRLYEKFRPSFLQYKKSTSPASRSATQSPTDDRSVKKIMDAITEASQRIENLSKSESCLLTPTATLSTTTSSGTLTYLENEFSEEDPIKPNPSFLFRSTVYSDVPIEPELVEAINTCVLTKAQSMDEIRFRQSYTLFRPDVLLESPEIPTIETEIKPAETTEDDYEFIQPPEVEISASEMFAKSAGKTTTDEPISISNSTSRTSDIDCSDIYQSIAEVFNTNQSITTTTTSNQDERSINSYETVDEQLLERIRNENGYEICEALDPPPEPPPPRHPSSTSTNATEPPLPAPKRAFKNYPLQPSESTASSTYEHIKYEKQPPRPPKTAPLPPHPTKIDATDIRPSASPSTTTTSDPYSPDTEYDGENIYDTIKPRRRARLDPAPNEMSHIDYDSALFMRPKRTSKCSLESDTISYNKTNSLYGTAVSRAESVSRPTSEAGGSSGGGGGGSGGDNSDGWEDMPDEVDDELEERRRGRFVVVCDRKRGARNSDWSQKVRDQRQNQYAAESYEDDSDHYYESLDPHGLNAAATTTTTSNCPAKLVNTSSLRTTPVAEPIHSVIDEGGVSSSDVVGQAAAGLIEEDYDSFDSDDESDEEVRKNDSGVDVSNNRLPDPPTPTNQVYAFMQKIRNFGSLSKNLSKFSKKSKQSKSEADSSQTSNTTVASATSPSSQTYENTQFYVNVDLAKSKPSRSRSKTPTPGKKPGNVNSSDLYENTEFHTPPNKSVSMAKLDSIPISPPLVTPVAAENNAPLPPAEPKRTFGRKKSTTPTGTTGKSFKSKFRKSLGPDTTINLGSSFNGNRSTFYVTDSVDMDSGVFTNSSATASTDSTIADPSSSCSAEPAVSPEVSQRKSSLTVRPLNPPPPPPVDRRASIAGSGSTSAQQKTKRLLGTTSWYAECSVFKAGPLKEVVAGNDETADGVPSVSVETNGKEESLAPTSPATILPPIPAITTTRASVGLNDEEAVKEKDISSAPLSGSWYGDAKDVYQTSGASVASSSGSSGVSTGGSGDDHSHSMFLNEPLYQIYSAAKLESISHDIEMDGEEHSDGYEEVGNTLKRSANGAAEKRQPSRPTALQLVASPKQGPSRTLWCEIPEVINSQILSTLSTTEKRLQEAKFEILTSEASYLKSLNLLRTHFMNHPAFRDTTVLSPADRKTLFSYMVAVQECSDRLLSDLESCWQDNIMLLGLSHSVYKHAEKYFHVYVAYCEHQGKLDRTLKRLKESKACGTFYQTLCLLESDASCCGLSLHSFLMLPMQRITRLPLLVDAVFGKLPADDDEYDSWKLTLALVNRIVGQCNEAANRSAQAYELQQISRQIEFPQSIRPLAIVPVGTGKLVHRALVRSGPLTHIVWRGDDGKLTFGKRFSRTAVHAFLFTDLLVLARRRDSGGQYLVADYCERQLLTVASGDVIPQLPTKDVPQAGKHLICMTLLENHEGKMTEMIFACPSETDRQRWLHATEPPASDNPDEKLYEQWDCPQVMARHAYCALQPDELGLDAGDVVNVTRKMADGWYQGERLRDGAQGWFPGNYTEEVASAHVRARNLKQRYRLLTFTAAYWEAQKRK